MQFFISLHDFVEPQQARAENRDRLLSALPDVQMVLTGTIASGLDSFARGRQVEGAATAPVPTRAELIAFRSDRDAEAAFVSPAGEALRENSSADLSNRTTYAAHGAAIVPFDRRQAGAKCFVAVAGFVLDPAFGGVDKAEHHYAAVHTRICARLPGCRGYIGGIVENAARDPDAPYRLALSFFDDEAGLRAALQSPVAREIEQDARGYSRVARLYFFDATVRC